MPGTGCGVRPRVSSELPPELGTLRVQGLGFGGWGLRAATRKGMGAPCEMAPSVGAAQPAGKGTPLEVG